MVYQDKSFVAEQNRELVPGEHTESFLFSSPNAGEYKLSEHDGARSLVELYSEKGNPKERIVNADTNEYKEVVNKMNGYFQKHLPFCEIDHR